MSFNPADYAEVAERLPLFWKDCPRGRIITEYQRGGLSVAEARQAMDDLNSRSIITPEMRQALLGIGATGTPDDKDAPKVGEVVDGYEYLGGNPASPTSWKKR